MLSDLTIVIPSYNHGKHIEKLLSNVSHLINMNLKIIIIDDASTDNSQSLIKNFHDRYSKNKNIQIVLKDKNSGLVDSLNTALTACKTKYIFMIASDDNINNSSFLNAYSTIKNDNSRFCIFGSENVFPDGKKTLVYNQKHLNFFTKITTDDRSKLIYYNHPAPILLQSTIFEVNLLKEINAFDKSLLFDDYPIFIKIFGIHKISNFSFHPEIIISKYYHHSDNTYKNHAKMYRMFVDVYNRLCPPSIYDITISQNWWLYFLRSVKNFKLNSTLLIMNDFKLKNLKYLYYFLFKRNNNEL